MTPLKYIEMLSWQHSLILVCLLAIAGWILIELSNRRPP
jgi:hypothetical protein